MARKIKTFTENNWWEWGRKINPINGDKIYVNNKTRDMQPFFTNDSGYYDGSILAIIPKFKWYNTLDEVIYKLNNWNWDEQGFLVGGRYIFGQRSLSNAFFNIN
jgi:adenine-specific DNA-methyltransferase